MANCGVGLRCLTFSMPHCPLLECLVLADCRLLPCCWHLTAVSFVRDLDKVTEARESILKQLRGIEGVSAKHKAELEAASKQQGLCVQQFEALRTENEEQIATSVTALQARAKQIADLEAQVEAADVAQLKVRWTGDFICLDLLACL